MSLSLFLPYNCLTFSLLTSLLSLYKHLANNSFSPYFLSSTCLLFENQMIPFSVTSLSHLHVSCPTSKTPPISFASHSCLSFPFTLHISPLLLSCFLLCVVFIGSSRSDSVCCFNTFLCYLCFYNLSASSPKPPNDLICPTFPSFNLPLLSHSSLLSPAISSYIFSKTPKFFLSQ